MQVKKIFVSLYHNMCEKGYLRGICYTVKKGLRKCFQLLIHNPQGDKKTVNDQIYEKWKCLWTRDPLYDEAGDCFYPLFVESYEYVKKKFVYNRKKNFFYKNLYLVVVLMFPLGAAGVFFANILFEETAIGDLWKAGNNLAAIGLLLKTAVNRLAVLFGTQMNLGNTVSYGVILFLFIVIARIIAKWLDIKKYQETWVRHSNHKYRLDQEMFKFVQNLDPYAVTGMKKRMAFIKNVMEIWDENQQKFVTNMDEREKELTDMLDHVGK